MVFGLSHCHAYIYSTSTGHSSQTQTCCDAISLYCEDMRRRAPSSPSVLIFFPPARAESLLFFGRRGFSKAMAPWMFGLDMALNEILICSIILYARTRGSDICPSSFSPHWHIYGAAVAGSGTDLSGRACNHFSQEESQLFYAMFQPRAMEDHGVDHYNGFQTRLAVAAKWERIGLGSFQSQYCNHCGFLRVES